MYAVVACGGKQYKVQVGQTVDVDLLPAESGQTIELGRVLMVGGDSDSLIGQPVVEGAKVMAEVVGTIRGEKIIVFKYKSKVRYRRKNGHRQSYTRVIVRDIMSSLSDEAKAEEKEAVASEA